MAKILAFAVVAGLLIGAVVSRAASNTECKCNPCTCQVCECGK